MSLLAAIVILVAYIIFLYRKPIIELYYLNKRCSKELSHLTGPACLPLIGAVHQFKWSNVEFTQQLEDWGRQYMLGVKEITGMVIVWVGPVPLLFCGTHESIRPVLESNVNISKPAHYEILSKWIGSGLLVSTNDKWFRRRKMLTPTFHFSVLQGYQDIFGKQGEILVNEMEKHLESGKYFDIFPYIKKCALDIICETAMGTEIHAQTGGNNEYVKAVRRISAIIWDYQRFPWLWFKPIWYLSGIGFEFDRLVKLTNDFTRQVITDRKRVLEEDGIEDVSNLSDEQIKKRKMAFLDMLLSMQKANNNLSDEDIREEVDTFMFEGHDTTSSGIGFTVWWLGQEKECQRKVQEECDEVFGDSDRLPTTDDLKRLVYLEKCVKESLRLMPSVPLIARRLSEDLKIGNTTLPEGLTVVIVPVTTQRDPRAYEKPEEFYPEHFDAETKAGRDPYSYIPFSAGPRNCIGQKFAIMEEKTVLSWIFRRYNVETEHPWPGNRPVPELILKPSDGFSVKITRRVR